LSPPYVTNRFLYVQVKSAFTRLYNKESHKTPYATQQSARKTKVKSTDDVLVKDGDGDENPDNDVSDEEDDDVMKSGMIKVKKETTSKATPASSSKGGKKKPAGGGKATTKSNSSKGKGKAKK